MPKAKIKKNINQIIRGAMHRPVTTDNFTLYVKVDDYKGSEYTEEKAQKSENYLKHCKTTFNSPTNIRRLFITGSKVVVQYYSSMITSGQQKVGHWKETSYKEEDNLFKIAEAKAYYPQLYSMYVGEKAINPKAEEPNNYDVSGNGIGVIANPWVCSNIEEVYFDWTLLISGEVAPYFRELCTGEGYLSFINKTTQYHQIKNGNLVNFFCDFNSGGVKDISKRFPRLRLISMISNLDMILEHPGMNKVDSRFSDISLANKTWYNANEDLIKASNSIVVLYKTQVTNINKEFIVKDNVYKFDAEVLSGVIKAYKAKVDDYILQKTYGTQTTSDSNDTIAKLEIDELEKYLVHIEAEYGEKVLKNTLLYVCGGYTVQELKTLFSLLTKPVRIKYSAMIGLTNV